MSAYQGCHNCEHRYGWTREYWKCSRTGFYTSTEMKCGGRCVDGQELRLWTQRPSLLGRIINLVRIDTAATKQTSAKVDAPEGGEA